MKKLQKIKRRENLFTDYYVFDTETRGLRAKPDAFIFGVVYSYNYTKVIYTVDDFIKEFQDKRYKKKKVFAHNAEYDLSVLFDNIYMLDNKAIFNNRFICCTNGNCLFADSFNIYPTSVKNIGDTINLKKLDIDEEYTDVNSDIKEVTQKMVDYCIRDCEIVYKALYEIFNKVGAIKITLAGLAMYYFRSAFQEFNIDYKDNYQKYFYESYYGGRTEVFELGKTNAVCYDINSMYPWAMKYTYFPNPRSLSERLGMSVNIFIKHYLKYYEGVAELSVFHVEHFFGSLPVRHEGKLMFPVGNLRGFWNFNEIRFALENNFIQIKSVGKVIYAPRMKSIFTSYVDSLYSEKQNAENAIDIDIAKKLLNSLYGKFAQKINKLSIYVEDIERDYDVIKQYALENKLLKIIPFNSERKDCFIEIKSNKGWAYQSIPLFSSYITSAARVRLLEYLLKYQNNSPVYCDTDSIFLKKDPEIKNSNELGEWKKEDKIVIEIRGLKNYTYIYTDKSTNKKHVIEKIKGVKKGAEKIGDKYKYKSLVKTKESLRRNIENGIVIEREKVLKLTYDKRKILKDGKTRPIFFFK
jgi:hypothetical protein